MLVEPTGRSSCPVLTFSMEVVPKSSPEEYVSLFWGKTCRLVDHGYTESLFIIATQRVDKPLRREYNLVLSLGVHSLDKHRKTVIDSLFINTELTYYMRCTFKV